MKIKNLLLAVLLLSLLLHYQCSLPDVADTTPPVVVLLYPYAGSVVSGEIIVSIVSSDDSGIDHVNYYLDGVLMGATSNPNPTFDLDLTEYADNQNHVFLASATDKEGNSGYSAEILVIISDTPDIIPPVVQILNPAEGQVVQDTVLVVSSANDDRIIREVAFFINGDSVGTDLLYPYEYEWSTVDLSDSTSHTVYAKAYDGSDNWAVSNTVTVTVFQRIEREPPSVVLLYPQNGETLTGAVDVRVDANDNIRVVKIEFFIDGILHTTDVNSPWGFRWDTSQQASGENHTLYIKAFDGAGNIGTTGPFSFLIL